MPCFLQCELLQYLLNLWYLKLNVTTHHWRQQSLLSLVRTCGRRRRRRWRWRRWRWRRWRWRRCRQSNWSIFNFYGIFAWLWRGEAQTTQILIFLFEIGRITLRHKVHLITDKQVCVWIQVARRSPGTYKYWVWTASSYVSNEYLLSERVALRSSTKTGTWSRTNWSTLPVTVALIQDHNTMYVGQTQCCGPRL